jgi:hypothetical protein
MADMICHKFYELLMSILIVKRILCNKMTTTFNFPPLIDLVIYKYKNKLLVSLAFALWQMITRQQTRMTFERTATIIVFPQNVLLHSTNLFFWV